MKKTVKQFLISFCLALVMVPVLAFALDSRDALMGLGMSPELANRIYTTLGGVNSTGNLVLPAASAKKLSITVAGSEEAFVDASGLGFPVANYETLAGAGTTVSDAAALSATKNLHQITGANGTVGWKFTTSHPIGSLSFLFNTTAGVAKIYAESGGTVNGAAVDTAFSALTGIKPILCFKTAALTYVCS